MDNLYVQRNPNYLDKTVTPNRRKLTAAYGDIVLWDDIGQSDFSAFLMQSTWQRRQTRVNLAYTLGWYEGDFDTAACPNFAYQFLFDRQRTSGDERHRVVLSEVTPDSVRVHAVVDHARSRARGRSSRSTDATSISTTSPATITSAARWRRPATARRARRTRGRTGIARSISVSRARCTHAAGRKSALSAEVFNVFNWSNNFSYGGTQFNATGAASAVVRCRRPAPCRRDRARSGCGWIGSRP